MSAVLIMIAQWCYSPSSEITRLCKADMVRCLRLDDKHPRPNWSNDILFCAKQSNAKKPELK